ncbi:MAG: hypothetical protein HQ536_03270 [Parcubacteria group bacterium]|nr:hypothetical protein [Parcubacteria group bacterium]
MRKNSEFKGIKDIFKDRKPTKKPPSYEWQELALRVINELGIPGFKRNAVFKVCKNNPKVVIEKCLNDTKELCQTGDSWKYFFKLIGGK